MTEVSQAVIERARTVRLVLMDADGVLTDGRIIAFADGNEARPPVSYRPGTIAPDSLGQVARLSWSDKGPRLAQEFLGKHGIALVVVRHLPRTYLDGAALKLGDGTPVVGLTLRYDRVDSFWLCLLHELAHLGSHGA